MLLTMIMDALILSRPTLPINCPVQECQLYLVIWKDLKAKIIPENDSILIISSWRDKTNTNYHSAR